jgi:membrane protein DedA with SNARE-associated domain
MDYFVPWLTTIIFSLGYLGLAVLVALGNIRLVPIPAELTLPLAGLLVGEGQLTFVLVLLWTTVASVIVSVILYLLGFWVGEESLRRFIRKFGRFVFVYESDLDKTCEMFRRHGGIACLVGRLIPGVTVLISIPAGIELMRIYGRFMIFTILATIAFNGAFVGVGWALGNHWDIVVQYAAIVNYVTIAAIAGGILWFVGSRWKASKQAETSDRQ